MKISEKVIEVYFKSLCTLNDGAWMEPRELSEMLESLGIKVKKQTVMALVRYIVPHGTESQSESIYYDQFTHWYVKIKNKCPEEVETALLMLRKVANAFGTYDLDKSGELDQNELRSLLEILMDDGESISIDEAMKEFDGNGDGKLTFRELADGLNIFK